MKKQQYLILVLSIIAVAFLTSCGTNKSNVFTASSDNVNMSAQQSLATCNQSTSTKLSFNLASVVEATSGQINSDWIKLKFNFLSSDVTKTGYSIRFFKWRVIGSTVQLDPSPLNFNSYLLSNSPSTGQTNLETSSSVGTTQITHQRGFYIRLNDDPQYPYQVLKVVVYKTDGGILTQSDILIPQFLADPRVYKTNPDGSVRAQNLQKLHPLSETDIGSWAQTQFKHHFTQYCF